MLSAACSLDAHQALIAWFSARVITVAHVCLVTVDTLLHVDTVVWVLFTLRL